MERKEIYSNDFISLYSDCEIGISDGVGYIDTMNKNETMELYNAIQKLVEEKFSSANNASRAIALLEEIRDLRHDDICLYNWFCENLAKVNAVIAQQQA